MKKLIIVFSVLISTFAQAQEAFLRRDLIINGGVSLIRYGNPTFTRSDPAIKTLPVSISAEYGLKPYLSVGVFVGYYSRQFRYLDSIPGEVLGERVFKSRYIPFGAKGTFHFTKWLEKKWNKDLYSEDVDIYLSALVGYRYNFMSHQEGTGAKPNSKPVVGGVLGIRYYLNYRFGIYAEVGPSIFGIIGVGLTGRF